MAYKKKGYRKKRALNLDGDAAEMVVDKNPARNIRYHEIAKEFVTNGFKQSKAYAAVTGASITSCSGNAAKLFKKPFMTDLVRAYLVGDHDAPRTKDWAVKVWTEMVQCNVLDYIDDDGEFLSVAELKTLPLYVQRSIKTLKVKTVEAIVKVKGVTILDDNGRPTIITKQHVVIELIDKQRALADLAKAEKWIETHMNITLTAPVGADLLIAAQQKRVDKLRVTDPNVIEHEPEN